MTKIKDLPLNERPREKANIKGIDSLSNAELLAIIISSGNKGFSALDIAYELLKHFDSIKGLANISLLDLKKIKGISDAKAIRILASFQLLRRYEKELKGKKTYIKSVQDALDLLLPKTINLLQENFLLIYLKSNFELIRIDTLYKGNKNSLQISPSDIIREVFKAGANRVIIAHNHPSNNVEPSKDDIETFKTLTLFLGTCSIDLIDSLILGIDESYSCNENKYYLNNFIA